MVDKNSSIKQIFTPIFKKAKESLKKAHDSKSKKDNKKSS